MAEFRYQPYYCEENVRLLLEEDRLDSDLCYAVVISNEFGACPLWRQRAAPSPDRPVIWDYHVVALEGTGEGYRVWDLDSRLDDPVAFDTWYRATFPALEQYPRQFQPRFRVVPAGTFLRVFSSDRSHMRDDRGELRKPAPDWDPIYQPERGMNLDEFIDTGSNFVGEVLVEEELVERFGARGDSRS